MPSPITTTIATSTRFMRRRHCRLCRAETQPTALSISGEPIVKWESRLQRREVSSIADGWRSCCSLFPYPRVLATSGCPAQSLSSGHPEGCYDGAGKLENSRRGTTWGHLRRHLHPRPRRDTRRSEERRV